jgi:hypothetical protein
MDRSKNIYMTDVGLDAVRSIYLAPALLSKPPLLPLLLPDPPATTAQQYSSSNIHDCRQKPLTEESGTRCLLSRSTTISSPSAPSSHF